MNKKNNIGFLFDLDGVLIDSEKEYSKLWAQVNHEYPTGIESLEEKIKGTTLDMILTEHYPDLEIQKKVVKRLYEMEANMKYEYKDGAEELLDKIIKREKPLALVTSSNDDKMKHLNDELPNLLDKFDVIVTANMITKSKPDPEGYNKAAQELGCIPEKCVVFEDSLQGVKAGNSSGAYVVGITGTIPEETLQPFSHCVVDTLLDFDLDGVIKILEDR